MLIALALLAPAADAPSHDAPVDASELTAEQIHAHGGCATMALYARNGRPQKVDLPRPDGAFADLQDRDTFGMPNVRYSDHFAFRWGRKRSVTNEQVFAVLDALERAYVVQIQGMEHRLPEEMDGYYLNVYLADSHTSAPADSDSAAAYVTSDRQGYAYIAFMERTLAEDNLEAAASTAAHEFYHVVQFETERYPYTDRDGWTPSAWFWEATANWAAGVTYPGQPDYARSLPVYAFYSHRRADYFRHPSDGGYETGYQYGAFIWPLHASQQAKDFAVVADVWKDEGDSLDPLEILRANLAERDIDMDALWVDHIARNATWDYPDRSIYKEHMQDAQGTSASNNLYAIELDRDGTDWTAPREDLIPERYGYNTLTLSRPYAGEYTIEIEGEATGTAGSPAQYGARLVIEPFEGDVEYRDIPFEGTSATLVADDLDDAFKVYIVVGAWSAQSQDISVGERFPYRVRLGYEGDGNPNGQVDFDDPPPRREQASACATGTAPAGLMLLGLGLILGIGRRRR